MDTETIKQRVGEQLAGPTFRAAAESIEQMEAAGIPKREAVHRVTMLVHGMMHMAQFDRDMVEGLGAEFGDENIAQLLAIGQDIALAQFAQIVNMVETSYPEEV